MSLSFGHQEADWRGRAWYLERCWPLEFARSAERPLPTVEPEPKKVSIAVVLNTGGKSLEEFVNFPMIEDKPPSSPAPEPATTWRPITVDGKVRWTDEPLMQDDADPNGAELP